jgi:hypothetical protein
MVLLFLGIRVVTKNKEKFHKITKSFTFLYSVRYSFLTNAVLENVPPDAGLQRLTNFSTLIVGLAGTRD